MAENDMVVFVPKCKDYSDEIDKIIQKNSLHNLSVQDFTAIHQQVNPILQTKKN